MADSYIFPEPPYNTNWSEDPMDMEYLDGFLKQEPEAPIVYESIPMALNRSNQSMNSVSASSVWSNNTLASSNTMSSYSSTNDPPIYQSYNSGYPEILGSESFTDNAVHYQTLTSNYHGRQTPSSLGWTTSAPVKEYYDLVCEKNKEPCLRIRMDVEPEYPETFVKPPTVYFDRDESGITDKKYHPCRYPVKSCWKEGKPRVFARTADLERHYNIVHEAANGEAIMCDYPKCARHQDRFTRKDHCRDHYKEYHREDMGAAKGEKTAKDNAKWQAKQLVWISERKVDPNWWRCRRCLDRIPIAADGYMCKGCKRECEPSRIARREALRERYSNENQASSYDGFSDPKPYQCEICHDTKCIENYSGTWDSCQYCENGSGSSSHYASGPSTWSQQY